MSDVLCDSFTGTNGTAITAHTPESGTAAFASAGGAQIQSNKLSFATPGVGADNYARWAGSGDGTTYLVIQFTTPAAGNRWFEFHFNAASLTTRWEVLYAKGVTAIGGEKFRLYQVTAGAYTQRATADVVLSAATDYWLVVQAVGDTVTATLYSATALITTLTYTVASRANKDQTGFAISTYTDASGDYDQGTVFDNFRVTTTDLFAAIYVDTTLAANSLSGYDPVTFLASVTGAGIGIPVLSDAVVTYAIEGSYIYCRGGQTHTTGIIVSRSINVRQFGVGTAVLDAQPAWAPNLGEYGFRVDGPASFSAVGVRGNLKLVGTLDEGYNPGGFDITLRWNSGGDLLVRGCWFDGSGHTAIKILYRPGSCLVEQNRFTRGGNADLDHFIYDHYGNATYQHNEFYLSTGYCIHAYNDLADPVHVIANVCYNGGGVAGHIGGGILVSGNTGHVIRHNTCVNCGNATTGWGIILWSNANNTTIQNNYCDNPSAYANGDIAVADGTTTSITAGYNRKGSAAGGAGAAAYVSTTDVATSDLFDSTPDQLTDARRTGNLADGIDTGADSDLLLDPTQDWPTPMAVSGIPPIGAFANIAGGPTTGSFSRGIAVRHHRTQLRIGRRL